jgi:hypothetical protein
MLGQRRDRRRRLGIRRYQQFDPGQGRIPQRRAVPIPGIGGNHSRIRAGGLPDGFYHRE